MSNMPRMAAANDTIFFRHIRQFHEKFVGHLGKVNKETLRCVAWQIDNYLEEHGKFKDADFLRSIITILEYVIQKKGNTNWTLARAKKDLRGRTLGVNQFKRGTRRKRAPVPIDLSKSIETRLVGAVRPEPEDSRA